MLNLREIKRICVVGAGTAGWFAALELRQVFHPSIEIVVISAPEKPIIGVGEGGIINFMEALKRLNIPLLEFMENTGAVHKLGFKYEGWRHGWQEKGDFFYHMFPNITPDKLWETQGYYPLLSALANNDIAVSQIVESIQLHESNISQDALTQKFINHEPRNFSSSFHFDTYKVGQYLRSIALNRGIIHKEGLVKAVVKDSITGYASNIVLENETIAVDFLIDASGFERLVIGKQINNTWQSFAKYLPMNQAIPFHLKHSTLNPALVTTATAMDAGWVWQIPLQQRIGAGYVFNSEFLTPDQAVNEIEEWLGHTIEPIRIINFDAGFYEKVWEGNVLAVGLASGFVEPLEATSIGQMLMQVFTFSRLIIETQGIISQKTIDYFNQQNTQSWLGIRDFIRMHYDTGRADTPFWKAVLDLPMSEKYKELKQCWQYRTPRHIDFMGYEMDESSHFGVYSWFAIGQALNIIPPTATVSELLALTADQRRNLGNSINEIIKKLKQ